MRKSKAFQTQTSKILALVLLALSPFFAKGQVFSHPRAKAQTADYVKIDKIEITDDNTIFDLRVLTRPTSSFLVSSKTYIVDSNGGEALYIEKMDGANLDELYSEADAGVKYLKLYFPKIDRNVNALNFRAGEDGSYWHFFEIPVATDIGIDGSKKSGRKGKDGNCRFIENPGYTAISGGFEIMKIEMCDAATILHFRVEIPRGGYVWIPSKSSIRDSNGGEDLFVKSAEGTNIDERISAKSTEDGMLNYKLFFPPLKKSVKKIDFREVNEGGSWFVYELDADV